MRRAVERFNGSDERRKVAGLIRSLGEPRAAVRPDAARQMALVTVAWELSWYQWEVSADGDGESVREVAKGDEVIRARRGRASLERGRRRGRQAAPAGDVRPSQGVRQARLERAATGRQRRRGRAWQPRPRSDRSRGRHARRRGPRGALRDDRPGDQQRRRVPGAAARDRASPGARGPRDRVDRRLGAVVRQVRGEYRVKDAALRELHARVREALEGFERWSIRNVPRDDERARGQPRQRGPRRAPPWLESLPARL